VSSDGTGVKIDQAAGMLTTETIAWIRQRLEQDNPRAWFHERWSRVRGQAGDPAYPSGAAPQGIDGMVFFNEVFPYDFDLTVVHERHLYLADDQYCLQPACTCDEFATHFVDLSTESPRAQTIGHARTSVRHLQAHDVHGPSLVGRLWRALLDSQGADRLLDRFQRMRSLERAQPLRRVRPVRNSSRRPRPRSVATRAARVAPEGSLSAAAGPEQIPRRPLRRRSAPARVHVVQGPPPPTLAGADHPFTHACRKDTDDRATDAPDRVDAGNDIRSWQVGDE